MFLSGGMLLKNLQDSYMQMENMNNEVFPILQCSYNRLRDPRLHKCFAYTPKTTKLREMNWFTFSLWKSCLSKGTAGKQNLTKAMQY